MLNGYSLWVANCGDSGAVLGTAVASCRLTPEMGIRIEDREREGATKRVGNGNGGDTGTTEMSAPEGGRAVASLARGVCRVW